MDQQLLAGMIAVENENNQKHFNFLFAFALTVQPLIPLDGAMAAENHSSPVAL